MAFFRADQGFDPYSYGGIGGLFGGMGGFNPYQQMPRMGGFNPYQQMPRMGGGFFGGFMPRFKRRARPAMPDYSGQITSLEEKIKALQEQLAARQTATPLPDPVANLPEPRFGTMGGPGYGRYPMGTAGPEYLYDDAGNPILEPPEGLRTTLPIGGMGPGNIPQVDPVALKELQDRVAGSGIPTPRPAPAIPMPGPSGMEGLGLDLAEIPMGRGRMGGGKTMVKPSSIERIMPMPKPMPEMPSFPMPQVDPMGRVAAPLTRGPVNVAINSPKLGIGRLGGRMMR